MFWVQLSTFVLFNVLILALLASQIPARWISLSPAQHVGSGAGDYTVWHLIADIEAERRATSEHRTADGQRAKQEHPRIPTEFPGTDPDDEPTGRHHLRI